MKSKFFLLLTMLLIICCQNHTECIVRQWLGKTITLDVKPEMIAIGRQPNNTRIGFLRVELC